MLKLKILVSENVDETECVVTIDESEVIEWLHSTTGRDSNFVNDN